jgi:hypothetical protein
MHLHAHWGTNLLSVRVFPVGAVSGGVFGL